MKKCQFLSLGMLMLFTSCGKVTDKPIVSHTNISLDEAKSFILNSIPTNTIRPVFISSDDSFMVPTESWVKNELTKEFNKFIFDYNLRTYKEGSNECDKFSLYLRTVANILNRHNPSSKTGIAVGQFGYVDGIYPHSINFIIVADEFKTMKVLYYEPQTSQIINLVEGQFAPLSYTF